jgi:DNA-binding response OmpR family regulator
MVCILVVEDENDIRAMIAEVLDDAGFTVIEPESADAAVPLLDTEGVRLIVTDIDMPGRLDGVALAFEARRMHPKIPVIFITGKPRLLPETDALGEPVLCLLKPFAFSALLSNIDRLTVDA